MKMYFIEEHFISVNYLVPGTILSTVTDLLMNSFHKFLLGGEA